MDKKIVEFIKDVAAAVVAACEDHLKVNETAVVPADAVDKTEVKPAAKAKVAGTVVIKPPEEHAKEFLDKAADTPPFDATDAGVKDISKPQVKVVRKVVKPVAETVSRPSGATVARRQLDPEQYES